MAGEKFLTLLCLAFVCGQAYAAVISPVGGGIKAPTRGPCSVNTIAIVVNTVADLSKRLTYKNTSTIILNIAANLTLTKIFTFNASYSCTIVRAKSGLSFTPWFWYNAFDSPAVMINAATNIQFSGVGVGTKINYTGGVECTWLPEFPTGNPCPAFYVYRGWAITFSNGRVNGRLDIVRSGSTEFSYNYLFNDYLDFNPYISYSVVRYAGCGDPLNLIRSMNKLTNNYIRGSWVGVNLNMAAVGVIVANNDIREFQFGGIQCGMGDGNVADCMLNTFQDNYISTEGNVMYPTPHGDGAGIYYDLHWYNPGNLDTCNYAVGTTHCHYLDYTTTGVTVDGAVCIKNHDGVKLNTGHANKLSSYLVVNASWQVGLFSCQSWCDNNCNATAGRLLGSGWYRAFVKSFDSPQWRKNWPHLADLCQRTQWLGIPCNPNPMVPLSANWTGFCSDRLYAANGKQLSADAITSGNCSGVPGLNDVRIISIGGSKYWAPYYINCNALVNVPVFNNITSTTTNYAYGSFDFDSPSTLDFGVSNLSSRMYQLYPNFISCSKRRVGVQTQSRAMAAAMSAQESSFSTEASDWWHDTYKRVPYNRSPQRVRSKFFKNRPKRAATRPSW